MRNCLASRLMDSRLMDSRRALYANVLMAFPTIRCLHPKHAAAPFEYILLVRFCARVGFWGFFVFVLFYRDRETCVAR